MTRRHRRRERSADEGGNQGKASEKRPQRRRLHLRLGFGDENGGRWRAAVRKHRKVSRRREMKKLQGATSRSDGGGGVGRWRKQAKQVFNEDGEESRGNQLMVKQSQRLEKQRKRSRRKKKKRIRLTDL